VDIFYQKSFKRHEKDTASSFFEKKIKTLTQFFRIKNIFLLQTG